MFLTDRLEIRAFAEHDTDFMMKLHNNLDVQKLMWVEYIVPCGPKFQETIRNRVENSLFTGIVEGRFGDLAGERIGHVAITKTNTKNGEGMITISLLPVFQGKGLGTEILETVIDHAFKNLALHRITLGVFPYNARALNTYRKLGFVEEGRLRKVHWLDGAWQDVILMALLDEEWAEHYATGKAE